MFPIGNAEPSLNLKQSPTLILTAGIVDPITNNASSYHAEAAVSKGDIVEYRLVLKNATTLDAGQLQVSIPIPDGFQFIGVCSNPDKAIATDHNQQSVLVSKFFDTEIEPDFPLGSTKKVSWNISSLDLPESKEFYARVAYQNQN